MLIRPVESVKINPEDLDCFKNMLTQSLDELLGKAGNTVLGLIGSEGH